MSTLRGPVGQRGFNGSQGPIGPAGPRGFNGTHGIQGLIGPQGMNGSRGPPGPQGPSGTGDLSQCEHKTEELSGSQVPISSNSLPAPTKVIMSEPSVSNLKGEIDEYSLCNFVDNRKFKDVYQIGCLTLTQMKTWVTLFDVIRHYGIMHAHVIRKHVFKSFLSEVRSI